MHKQNQEYIIERFSKNHLPDLEKLYTAVYAKQPATGLFANKYDTAYTGIE